MSDLSDGLKRSLEQNKWVIGAKVVAEGIVRDAEAGKRPKDKAYRQAKAYLQKSEPK